MTRKLKKGRTIFMLTEDYCSYEVAKLLKEKGFEQYKCQHSYNSKGVFQWSDNLDPYEYSAPTHQMAMKWLREIHWVISIIPKSFYADGRCTSWTYSIWADDNLEIDGEEEWENIYGSYEEATEAALKYSLKNLI